MTATSPPPVTIWWSPTAEGIELGLQKPSEKYPHMCMMPMMSVHELRDDMTEASMLARGLEKVECFFMEIDKGDFLSLMGDSYEVTDVLEGRDGWVVQFKLNTYSPDNSEITFPPDQLVTVWRPIE